ncbi:hypothetical protein H6F86_27745 [Phormidium sp. FACHB-592]|uniref:Uncharacterized protein n=1 Tax=Stenomitos frigidus AS-A4 TaxID=2933935 RepID=A0ABV0KD67_9CYAN|nr:hypothetical protein [Phormidium sp. FACHB-592]MBD2077608.1 hypothetical protein [Phormidium sp. FACHB-592]
MKSLSSSTSVCRRCQYYAPEGRRGGHCQQLDVAVQGAWTACALAIPPFSPAWENLEDIMAWQQKNLVAMQASAESAMTEALSDTPRVGASSLSESMTIRCCESAEPACNSAISTHTEQAHITQPHVTHLLPVAHVQTLGIKALWM